MKKIWHFCVFGLGFSLMTVFSFAQVSDKFVKDKIVSEIRHIQGPVIKDGYILFTAEKTARHVGVVFDFENYRTVHSFERTAMYDSDGKMTDSLLFYILPLPPKLNQIKYRLIVDGLWTPDPMNRNNQYQQNINAVLSVLSIERPELTVTANIPQNGARFVFKDKPGAQIRVAGTFNNWDSYMYTLQEIQPGIYQLDLPLPSGTYYYAFYNGTRRILDPGNPKKAYTKDGSPASELTIQ